MIEIFEQLIYNLNKGKVIETETIVRVVENIPKRSSYNWSNKQSLDQLFSSEYVHVSRVKDKLNLQDLLEYCIDNNKYPYLVHKDFIAYKTVSIPFALLINEFDIQELIDSGEYTIYLLDLNPLKKVEKNLISEFSINTDISFKQHISELQEAINLYKQSTEIKVTERVEFLENKIQVSARQLLDYIIQPVHCFIIEYKIFPYYGFLAFDDDLNAYRLLTSEGHCNINFSDDELSVRSNELCYGNDTPIGLSGLDVFRCSNADSRYNTNISLYPVSTLEYMLKTCAREAL